MRILYLSQYYSPEFGAAAARARSMSRWLARFGHEVTVVTALPNYLLETIPEPYRGKRWMQEEMDGVQVYRAWLYTSSKRDNWRRMANYLSFMLSSWWHGRGLPGPFDVVIASSPPLFLGLTGVALARRFRVPLVFDVRDMWPEIAVKQGIIKSGSLMERTWRAMADFTYDRSAAIVPVTTGIKQDMIARGLSPEKISLVHNGVDLEQIQENAHDLRNELGLGEKFVALFAGLIGVMQEVSVIVNAALLLKDHPNIQFLIVGDGVERDKIAKRLQTLQLKSVTLLPRQPRERMPHFLNTADVCLATLSNAGASDAVPLKMLEGWAYRKPVIITSSGVGAQLTTTWEAGLATPPGDARALANAILTLEADRALLKRMGENGRRCIEEKLNREALARAMEQVLTGVTKQK